MPKKFEVIMEQRDLFGLALLAGVGCYLLLKLHRSKRPNAEAKKKEPAVDFWLFSDGEQPDVEKVILAAAQQHHISVEVAENGMFGLEQYVAAHSSTASASPPPCIVLLVTTGEEGEITSDAAQAALRYLARKTNGPNTLRGFRFAVIGLGDSNTLAVSHRSISWASGKDCNQVGELFDRWLEQVGGTRLLRRCESDARTDHDALEPWLDKLWAALRRP